ncbi:DUF551 domain-containing protein [Escherichia coli]|nr:DUF551 domain-containing protein [Escherichia coli]EKI3565320.1 DUF551 domain-containing protein [Escherichia coli]EKK4929517.1 DUF551 domain-containing protein [Escherichia coli]EMA4659896.1 DUF551 domain-containing protein [Escherichia coli]HBU9175529.1 DUF551 domain-containing protein [Escherichia coli]
MITITKERLLTIQQWRETYGPGSNVVLPAEEAEELARIVLASLEAEPVAWMCDDEDGREYNGHNEFSYGRRGIPLYAAPPAQVVPEEKPMPNPLSMYAVDAVAAIAEVRGWNACRAAMLQAEPVSNSDELPLDYLQGHKDGLEWAAQLAEANHPQTGDWLYDDPIDLARAIRKGPDMPTVQAGNYPVTPDGWISCSERMPAQDDWILIYSKHGEYMAGQVQGEYVELSDGTLSWLGNALYWMPLPEPPQEVN